MSVSKRFCFLNDIKFIFCLKTAFVDILRQSISNTQLCAPSAFRDFKVKQLLLLNSEHLIAVVLLMVLRNKKNLKKVFFFVLVIFTHHGTSSCFSFTSFLVVFRCLRILYPSLKFPKHNIFDLCWHFFGCY